MPQIETHPLPTQALLTTHANAGAYTDCFATDIARTVSHAEFVEALYTGGLFKDERFLLRVFIAKPSTDLQARQLTAGELNEFAAWRVEARAVDQLPMCDIGGRVRPDTTSYGCAPRYTFSPRANREVDYARRKD